MYLTRRALAPSSHAHTSRWDLYTRSPRLARYTSQLYVLIINSFLEAFQCSLVICLHTAPFVALRSRKTPIIALVLTRNLIAFLALIFAKFLIDCGVVSPDSFYG